MAGGAATRGGGIGQGAPFFNLGGEGAIGRQGAGGPEAHGWLRELGLIS